MKVTTHLYTIQIEGGFFDEADPKLQSIYAKNAQHKKKAESYGWDWRRPKAWNGTAEEWKAYVENKDNDYANEYAYWDTFSIRVDAEDLAEYATKLDGRLNITHTEAFTLKMPHDAELTKATSMLEMHQQLNSMSAKTLEQLRQAESMMKLNADDLGTFFNNRCNQHQPTVGLWNFNETMLLENSCTDQLQDYLDDGWRIIAVSPQPDQRRPDYILARFNINRDFNKKDGALRG